MVGAWHWGQRLDPLGSAFQVWCVYSASLWSHNTHVNLMSEITDCDDDDVRMTECLVGLVLFSSMVCISNESAALQQLASPSRATGKAGNGNGNGSRKWERETGTKDEKLCWARPHTFLMSTLRPRRAGDEVSKWLIHCQYWSCWHCSRGDNT